MDYLSEDEQRQIAYEQGREDERAAIVTALRVAAERGIKASNAAPNERSKLAWRKLAAHARGFARVVERKAHLH